MCVCYNCTTVQIPGREGKQNLSLLVSDARPGEQTAEPSGNAGLDLVEGVDGAGEVDEGEGGEGGGVPDGGARADCQVFKIHLVYLVTTCISHVPIIFPKKKEIAMEISCVSHFLYIQLYFQFVFPGTRGTAG